MTEPIAELPKGYEPKDVESHWYRFWMERGYFHADENSKKPPFCIVIPPPNVTGALHMGHALTDTIQDVLIRWKRMSGFNALWLPGTDHAGIATQMIVEKELKKTEGKSRHDLGRAEFIRRVWEWKAKYGGRIKEQHKVLGASLDWDRERFTLDEGLSRAVREVFVRLHEEGLIYRDSRLINWCPQDHTALSDLEVEHEENVKGELWSFAYPLSDGSGEVVVATTRPETMLGDTAVAVHPDDERYRHLHGKTVRHPITGRAIPIVTDAILVDPKFGTGAVKVTPAHDFNDFEVGKRHGLEMINLLRPDGTMNENAGPLQGLSTLEARARVKELLREQGLERGTQEHLLALGRCQRCHTVVEPYLSPQWFVKIGPLAKPAIEAVEKGDTVFIPETWTNTYMAWMNNIHDWCISRQLWWGHQVPAWYCPDGHVTVTREDPTACATCGSHELRRDEDVLDTWFSSALWPFSTLGWPDRTKALETFYPTAVMETGFDIIFFWVARMMMMGLHFMGDVPFKTVFLHAMVRDEKGEKMSKTKGNVIDPLDVTAKYGADALRFTLASMAAQGRDIKLSLDRVAGYKAFANKLWNAARFALLHVKDLDMSRPLDEAMLTDADRWILARYHRAVADVTASLDAYRLNDACSRLYRFLWNELCDWYIELVKPRLYDGTPEEKAASARVLRDVLEGSLRLLHPVMPFVTEEIWQRLPRAGGDPDSIMVAAYPVADARWAEDRDSDRFDLLIELIEAIRSLRVDIGVPEGAEVEVHFATDDEASGRWLEERASWMRRLAKVKALVPKHRGWPSTPGTLVHGVEVRLALAGVVDVAELVKKLEKDEAKLAGDLAKVQGRLGNPGFVAKAPPEVVEKDRALAGDLTARLAKVRENLQRVRAPADPAALAEPAEPRPVAEAGAPEASGAGAPAIAAPPKAGTGIVPPTVTPAGTTPPGLAPSGLAGLRDRIAAAVADAVTRTRILEGIERLGEGRVEDALKAFVNAARGTAETLRGPARPAAGTPGPRAAKGGKAAPATGTASTAIPTRTAEKAAPKAAARPATGVAPKAAAKPATKAAAKPATKPAPKAAVKPATKAAAKPATKAAPKAAAKPAPRVAAQAAAKAAPRAAERPATKAAPKAATKPATRPAPKAAAKSATKPAARRGATPKPAGKPGAGKSARTGVASRAPTTPRAAAGKRASARAGTRSTRRK
jgi:valyl-tRNA synthetase